MFSLLSVSLLCSSSPTPPGAPNCVTMFCVLLNCSSVSRCFMHLRYLSSVSFRLGTGSFGRAWRTWRDEKLSVLITSFPFSKFLTKHDVSLPMQGLCNAIKQIFKESIRFLKYLITKFLSFLSFCKNTTFQLNRP